MADSVPGRLSWHYPGGPVDTVNARKLEPIIYER